MATSDACIFRVYEAEQTGRPGFRLRISVSAEREPALREDISTGRRLLRLLRLVLETDDKMLAERSSTRHFA